MIECKRILVIDDDRDFVSVIREKLNGHNVEIDIADNPKQADEMLRCMNYHIVLADFFVSWDITVTLKYFYSYNPQIQFIIVAEEMDRAKHHCSMFPNVAAILPKSTLNGELADLVESKLMIK